ncbi:MAG TPA: radical SAM protein, partial [Candidatus Wallbacteria bacterium]|nr:radical SAM protein [Candidatus Wallbacteria bacterium]
MNIIFGPVPSRRLGKSLGVNNIPPKTCSYSCVYCQLGRAAKMTSKRAAFYGPDEIFESARIKVE